MSTEGHHANIRCLFFCQRMRGLGLSNKGEMETRQTHVLDAPEHEVGLRSRVWSEAEI